MATSWVQRVGRVCGAESDARSCVAVFVEAATPDDGLGFSRYVLFEDRERIAELLESMAEKVRNMTEGDDVLHERVLKEIA